MHCYPADDICAFLPEVFDIVIAKHVVEHLKQPEQAIAEMSRILKPGGLLVLATPNLEFAYAQAEKEQLDRLQGSHPHQPQAP